MQVSIGLGGIDVRHAIEPGGKSEPEGGKDGRQPEGEEGAHAGLPRLVELVAEGVGHAGGEPGAHAGGVGAQQQAVDALAEMRAAGHHVASPRRGQGVDRRDERREPRAFGGEDAQAARRQPIVGAAPRVVVCRPLRGFGNEAVVDERARWR